MQKTWARKLKRLHYLHWIFIKMRAYILERKETNKEVLQQMIMKKIKKHYNQVIKSYKYKAQPYTEKYNGWKGKGKEQKMPTI